MTRLPTLNARKVIQALKRAGFEEVRQHRSSHLFLANKAKNLETCVPIHGGDLGRSLVRAIIQQAGLTEEEFRNLL
jgi:predicted RNA binding protein YcfA (HicA-like mRNA interferase family)